MAQRKFLKFFFKRKDACKGRSSLWDFKFRSREEAGQAAAGPAAAFAELEYQVGKHSAAALVDGGDLVGAATAEPYFLNSLHGASAAIFHGDLGRASAVTEAVFSFNALHGTLNSSSLVADAVTAGAFRMHDFEGHGRAASVLGDTGSAFSRCYFLIHDPFASSLIHPIHACAHSRLDLSGVGFGVCGAGVACPSLLSPFCGSRVDDDVDDACMDGSNSLIQGSGCHATACACSDALQNSRQVRGHCLRGGTKCTSTGSGVKVWLRKFAR